MSSKINVIYIIKKHYSTLENENGNISKSDITTFIISPLVMAIVSLIFSFNLSKETTSLLVNFGSIFTALLLSVLVLVYDQEKKLDSNDKDDFYRIKKSISQELNHNISYSIICSMFLVFLCLFHSFIVGTNIPVITTYISLNIKLDMYLLTPLIAAVFLTILLNILMIIKRIHTLLTN